MTLPPKDIIPHVTDKDGLLAALLKAINTHIRQEKYDEFCRKQGESIDPKVPILAKVVKNLVDGNDLNKDDRKTLGDLQLSREIQQRILAARQRTSAAIGKQGAHLMAGNKFDINAAARLIAVEAG
jgi:hypothetical protein